MRVTAKIHEIENRKTAKKEYLILSEHFYFSSFSFQIMFTIFFVKQKFILNLFPRTAYSSKVANQTFIQSWYQKGMDDDMMGFESRLNDMEMYVSDVNSRTIVDPDALQTLRNYRRFQQLKTLALWLQREPRFGKYCYYGCYCLDWIHRLEEPENVPAGKGTRRVGVAKYKKIVNM